ncbi:MAG: ABC transporter permease [Gammaproteobacteria bacterium]
MQLVVLKTDVLFFVLLALALAYVFFARRREHLVAPWRQVGGRPLGMAAAVVLLSYLVIAVLDSFHFHPALEGDGPNGEVAYGAEIRSLLDVALAPLRERVEKTYSAPFAVRAYAKEMIEQPDGSTRRGHPRLEHAGAHLSDPDSERGADILCRVGAGIGAGLLVWSLISASIAVGLAWRRRLPPGYIVVAMARGRLHAPWRSILATLGVILLAGGSCAALAPYYHVLGTDQTGNDVLYQALKSIRTGLLIGTLTTLVMLPFAIVLGIAAGYFRGWVDDVIQYLYTTLSSIPGVLLIAAAALMLEVYMARNSAAYTSLAARADLRLLALCMILGVTTWTGLCRYLRGEALKLREVDFISAARAFGVPHRTILLRHIVPNIMHIVMISIVLDFSGLVLAEAALTYIDIGVDPSMESWGNMINSARLELAREPVVWWSLLAAFAFMFTLVLAANVFADAVRDAFDPRLRGAR